MISPARVKSNEEARMMRVGRLGALRVLTYLDNIWRAGHPGLARIIRVGWDEVAQLLGGPSQTGPTTNNAARGSYTFGKRPKAHHRYGLLDPAYAIVNNPG